jgi:hypothetical protein
LDAAAQAPGIGRTGLISTGTFLFQDFCVRGTFFKRPLPFGARIVNMFPENVDILDSELCEATKVLTSPSSLADSKF